MKIYENGELQNKSVPFYCKDKFERNLEIALEMIKDGAGTTEKSGKINLSPFSPGRPSKAE